MTTIVGLKTNSGEEAIVLAADTQLNVYDEKGNVSHKREITKLHIGKYFAIADAGYHSTQLDAFYSYLKGDKTFHEFEKQIGKTHKSKRASALFEIRRVISQELESFYEKEHKESSAMDEKKGERKNLSVRERALSELEKSLQLHKSDPFEEAIRTGIFSEIIELNRLYMLMEDSETESLSEFLLGINKPQLELYHIDSYGNMREVENEDSVVYHSLGTGSKEVNKYFSDEEFLKDRYLLRGEIPLLASPIRPDDITTPVAIGLVLGAFERAREDVNTNDLVDIAIITKDKVSVHGNNIREQIEAAKHNAYASLIQQYLPH